MERGLFHDISFGLDSDMHEMVVKYRRRGKDFQAIKAFALVPCFLFSYWLDFPMLACMNATFSLKYVGVGKASPVYVRIKGTFLLEAGVP